MTDRDQASEPAGRETSRPVFVNTSTSQPPTGLPDSIEFLTVGDALAVARITLEDPNLVPRDLGLFTSAVQRPATYLFGAYAYGDVLTMAAALLESLARDHALIDGNKRCAWACTWTFLEINGYPLGEPLDEDAAEHLMLCVAQGHMELDKIAAELWRFVSTSDHHDDP